MSYTPRTPTEYKTFDKLCQRLISDKAILIGKYVTIRGCDKISFMCGACNTQATKKYTQIVAVSGAFCKKCTYAKSVEKRTEKLQALYGVDNISQLKEIKEKKHSTALLSGVIMIFSKWIELIKAQGLDTVWEYLFTEIKGYDLPHTMKHIPCGILSEKSPRSHLNQDKINTNGQGCITCYHNAKRLTREEFTASSKEKFGYRFSGYECIPEIIPNNKFELTLVCNEHGVFSTSYDTHLNKAGGCLPCSNHMKTKKEIIELYSLQFHNNGVELILDDLSDSDIMCTQDKFIAKCLTNPLHSTWTPLLHNLISRNSGCPSCAIEEVKRPYIDRFGEEKCKSIQLKTIATCLDKFGVERPSQLPDIRDKAKTTMLKKYGVEYALQSTEIMAKAQHNATKYKMFKFPSGTERKVQGYEPFALQELLSNGIIEEQIITDRRDIPRIPYMVDDKKRYYHPDMYLPHINTIIEVKSTWTYKLDVDKIELTRKATIEAGFAFELHIYDNKGKRVILPNVIEHV